MHLQYRGQPIPIITVPPDWDEALIVTSHHKTLVSEALDLSEERLGMFPRPLYGIRYQTTTLSARETGYLRKLFELSQGLPVGCPFWSDAVALTAAAPPGATSLSVGPTANTLFATFTNYALLWVDFETWEVVSLASVLGDTVALASPTERAFNAGAQFLPLAFGHVRRPDGVNISTEASTVLIEFSEVFSTIAPVTVAPGRLSPTVLAAWEALKRFDGAPEFIPGIAITTEQEYGNDYVGTMRGVAVGIEDPLQYEVRVYSAVDIEYYHGRTSICTTDMVLDQTYPYEWNQPVKGLTGLSADFDLYRVDLFNLASDGVEYFMSSSDVFVASVAFDDVYDPTYLGPVSGYVSGLDPAEFALHRVDFYNVPDDGVEYFQGSSAIAPDGTWACTMNHTGVKLAKLVRIADGRVRGLTGTGGIGSFYCPNAHLGWKVAKLVRRSDGKVVSVSGAGRGGWTYTTASPGWKTIRLCRLPVAGVGSVVGNTMTSPAPFFTPQMAGRAVFFQGLDHEVTILSVQSATQATLAGAPLSLANVPFELVGEMVAEKYFGVGLVRSFAIPKSDPNFNTLYKRCYLYDQAIAVVCAVNMGDAERARRWTHALLEARSLDGQFPFSVNAQSGELLDPYYRNGAQFWCIYALLWFLKHYPASDLAPAIAEAVDDFFTLANSIYWTGDNAGLQTHAFRLGKGKYALPSYAFDPDIVPQACGVEHNLDGFFALKLAGEVLHNPAYTVQAAQLRELLLTRFWDAGHDRAYQGVASPTEVDEMHALDCASWYSLVAHDAGDRAKQEACLRIIEDYAVTDGGVHGYTAYRPQYGYYGVADTLWIEGTCGVILAWIAAGRVERALREHAQLAPLLRPDGFPYVTQDDAANELRPWTSVASTGWFVICRQPNGFWGVANPDPDQLMVRPNFTRVKLGQLDDADYQSQGFGLATPWKATAGPKRKLTYDFTLANQTDIGRFREFVAAMDGRRLGFWLPVWLNEYKLAADAPAGGPAGGATITVQRSRLDEADAAFSQFQKLYLASGDTFEIHTITGVQVVGNTEVITLGSPLGVPFRAHKTLCGGLLRARLADDRVEYQHTQPGIADVRINFVELPTEYDVQHQGSRPVFLYEFKRGANVWRFANYGADIQAGGFTWTAADITHGEIASGLDMVGDELSVQVATDDPDHPLRLYLDRAAMELTTLSVYRTDADSLLVDLDAPVFAGRVKRIPFRKKGVIDLSVSTLFRLSDEAVPRLMIQRTCNHRLFDGGCGLSEEAFTTAGLLVAVSSEDPPYVEASEWGAKAAAEGDPNWFALGKVRVGTEVRLCVGQDGSRLYLNAPFRATALGGVATATPGCDKRVGTCVGKFDNLAGHAGFPFIPSTNPQLEELTTPEPSMGKK